MRFDTLAADRITAAVLFGLGAAMCWGGVVMDRLEIRQIHPASIPGLVPMILGAILMLCAVLLALSTRGRMPEPEAETGNWRDFGFVAVWSCIYALILVGSLQFAVATTIYIAVFSGWFLWRPSDRAGDRIKRLALVAFYAIAMAAGISALFRYGFLVRLP